MIDSHACIYPPGAGAMTIVHGRRALAKMAVTLARSIRLRDPYLPLAVVTDFEPAVFEGLFDFVISWDFSRWSHFDAKLEMYEMSPFETTLFLDADMLVYRPLAEIFDCFAGSDFGVVGHNVQKIGWFEAMELIHREFPADSYCFFNGGLYFFRRSETAAAIFGRVRSIYERYDELRIHRHGGYKADQAIMCLAAAQSGIKAMPPESGRGYRMDTFWPTGWHIETDVLSGVCVQSRPMEVRRVHRAFLHFVGSLKSSYDYTLEALRLEWLFRHGRRGRLVDALLRFYALVLWRRNIPAAVRGRVRSGMHRLERWTRRGLGR